MKPGIVMSDALRAFLSMPPPSPRREMRYVYIVHPPITRDKKAKQRVRRIDYLDRFEIHTFQGEKMTKDEEKVQEMERYLQRRYPAGRILTRTEAVRELGLENGQELDDLLGSGELTGLHIAGIARYLVSM